MSDAIKIKVLLCGGLGNQLFQYSFGRALALRNGAMLKLDAVTLFHRDKIYRRSFALDEFQIPLTIKINRKMYLIDLLYEKLLRTIEGRRPLNAKRFIEEDQPWCFYSKYLDWKVQRSVTLLGYWQCPLYFEEFSDLIKTELRFREPLCISLQDLNEQMKGCESVAVHVRRFQYDRCLGLQFYKTAIASMRNLKSNLNFYVFTDSPDWCIKNLGIGKDLKLVPNIDLPDIEYFKLMISCKHFIIANSSFSWWAAWLGSDKEKQVIAPSGQIWDNPDILCPTWIPIMVSRTGDLVDRYF